MVFFETHIGRFRGRVFIENDIRIYRKLRNDLYFAMAAPILFENVDFGGKNANNLKFRKL